MLLASAAVDALIWVVIFFFFGLPIIVMIVAWAFTGAAAIAKPLITQPDSQEEDEPTVVKTEARPLSYVIPTYKDNDSFENN